MSHALSVRLCVFDWAGTLIDHGSLAPLVAFTELFARRGISVSTAQVRAPMGTSKRAHIEALLAMPEVARAFREREGRDPDSRDVDVLYEEFHGAQLRAIAAHDELIEHVPELFVHLRERDIRIATTTGYFREAKELVTRAARAQGAVSDHDVCADDVREGRPAPFMIHACMQALSVYSAEEVLVVGDTPADVAAAKNAGCLAVAVARSGNEVGLSAAEWNELDADAREEKLARARTTLWDSGADFVIDTVADLPAVIERAERLVQTRDHARALRKQLAQLRALEARKPGASVPRWGRGAEPWLPGGGSGVR